MPIKQTNGGPDVQRIGVEPREWKDPAPSLKEKLAHRSAMAASAAKRTFRSMLISIGAAVLLATLIVGGYSWYTVLTDGNFFTSRMTDERSCKVKLGSTELTGRRYYSYRYVDILGTRLIFKDDIEERTILNVPGAGYTIVTYQKDFSSDTTVVPKGEVGIQPLKRGEAYTFFTDGKMASKSYSEFCTHKAPEHPFATTD